MSFQLWRKLTGSQHFLTFPSPWFQLCMSIQTGEVAGGEERSCGSDCSYWEDSHDRPPGALVVWQGCSVTANWLRMEDHHSGCLICGPQTCCPAEAAYFCWRQRTRPADQRELEKSLVRPLARPGPAGLACPTFLKLVSGSSPASPASTPTICPQT